MRLFHAVTLLVSILLWGNSIENLQASTEVKAQQRPLIEADWLAHDGSCSLAQTRQVVTTAAKLLKRLEPKLKPGEVKSFQKTLASLERRLAEIEGSGTASRELYLQAHWLRREIAFTSPLLKQIEKLLFITRHDAKGVYHMVDQFYGFNAPPGGDLLVLQEPFGPEPKLVRPLGRAVVQQGRLKGRTLQGGAFLSPEVSFDGKTVLFAWTEGTGNDLEWSPSASYHIFKANADGSDLVQLTDGSWNDFDPCFLPNGRIVFVSERRGGYLRCGRHCPVYTLFSMAADGSDILCMSFHETHEWHPSITADGRIVYTRWDYIDRDTNMAHHPWTCRPDGGDPRAFHGNYPIKRETRPWMEMDIRAIPGSRKYVATAAAHHGHAFGSLVIIDPEVQDDNADSQVTRLTPDVPFPEAEQRVRPIAKCMVYGTPWPLSEDDFLCVYDPATTNRGIYWIDRFGNKELIYRDPTISSLSPMPLQPRTMPPVTPDETLQVKGAAGIQQQRPSTVAIMNVYESDFAWPQGTRISALRVIQVLPKTTAAPNQPRIGVAEQTNARGVLGTVPVQADGSAYFQIPPGKEVYFQALDEHGLAVQSMRSGTYVHEGERLLCQGCHEPRHRSPARAEVLSSALRRLPSEITPEVEGSHPFNYVRLVQPVLDRNCVECHQEKKALDLTGKVEGKHGWTRSYSNLASKYGFYFHVTNGSINSSEHGGSRTLAGKFGARASKLLPYLDQRHYGVNLSKEEFHRVALWLDCNSEFYGSYEETEKQARGEIVWPTLH